MSGSGRFDQKKRNNAPAQQQEAEQEVEESALEAQEPEFARQQNQVGNQAVSSMIAGKAGQSGTSDGSSGGIDVAHALKQEAGEQEGMAFGGEDDPIDSGPLTISPAAFSASTSIRKFKDRGALREYMPDDRLPDPDDTYLAAIRTGHTTRSIPHTSFPDKFLQPSEQVVASSLRSWAEGICYWSATDLTHRCVRQFIRRPPPCIQDRNGRVLFGRARTASAALALLTDSPVVKSTEDALTYSYVAYCLEISGRLRTVEALRIEALGDKENRLPLATKLLAPRLPGNNFQRPKRALSSEVVACLNHFLRQALDPWDPHAFLPDFRQDAPASEDEDDPLRLDAFMESILGKAKSREDYQQETVLGAAENLATECARLRIQTAGLGVVLSQLSEHWIHGSPDELLLECSRTTDRAIREALKLLVEVATAAKKQAVQPAGLVNGLRHAASRIERISSQIIDGYVDAVSSVFTGDPELVPPATEPAPDPLAQAWADAHPAAGLEWLASLPASSEREFAILMTRADLGLSAPALLSEAMTVRERALTDSDHLKAHIAGMITCCGFLQESKFEQAYSVADAMQAEAWSRQNGLAFAAATLTLLETLTAQGRHEAAKALHLEAGRQAWLIGAEAAVSILGRWERFEEE